MQMFCSQQLRTHPPDERTHHASLVGILATMVVCAFATLTACDSSSSGGGSDIMGTLGGTTPVIVDQSALGSATSSGIQIELTSFPGACDAFGQLHGKQNVRYLSLELGSYSGATNTIDVSNAPNRRDYAYYDLTSSTCELVPPAHEATSGTVTFTDVTAAGVKGTFDLTFSDGHITGSFDAPFCTSCGTTCTPTCTP